MSCVCSALFGASINAQKYTKYSFNGGPHAALEGTRYGGCNVTLEGAP